MTARRTAERLRAGMAVPVLGLVAAFALALGTPAEVRAQRDCQLVESELVSAITLYPGARLISALAAVVQCEDGSRIQADSAEVNEVEQITRFFGNVIFENPERRLTSELAEYFEQLSLLVAWDQARLTQLSDGTSVRGDTIQYYRVSQYMSEELLTVQGGRVRSDLPSRGEGGAPYRVESDRLVIQGSDRVSATGSVTVVRDSLRARGDTMNIDPEEDRIRFAGNAALEGDEYDLQARIIDLLVPGDTLREVIATDRATLLMDGLSLTAPGQMRISLAAGQVERLIGVAPRAGQERAVADSVVDLRPRAEAEGFLLVGDSLDISAPGGSLEQVVAVGRARGEALPQGEESEQDRIARERLPELLQRDWIEGDEITATFVPEESAEAPDAEEGAAPPPAADSTQGARYRIETLLAQGNARSLYRVRSGDSVSATEAAPPPAAGDSLAPTIPPATPRLPALHYVVGKEIRILLVDGEVSRMEVDGPTGIHLEPRTGEPRPTTPEVEGAGETGSGGSPGTPIPPSGGDHTMAGAPGVVR